MKNWSLNAKIVFLLSIFITGTIIVAAAGLMKMGAIKESMNSIVNVSFMRRIYANRLNSSFSEQQVLIRNLVLAQSQEEREQRLKLYNDAYVVFDKNIKTALEASDGKSKESLTTFSQLSEEWKKKNEPILKSGMEGNIQSAHHEFKSNAAIRKQMDQIIDDEIKRSADEINASMKTSEEDYSQAKSIVIITSILSIFSGVLLAFFILRALGKSINQVISNLLDNSNQMTDASKQIASSAEALSSATTEQASSLEETAASIEEMSSMVQKNADNAKRTSDLAYNSNKVAQKGKTVVTDMIKAIDDISTSNTTIMHQIDESNQKISDIVKVISEIGEKTKVINDIVFQTKLLSFNASVEAARAGEHGKGFAVVAEEVGNLAQMSGNAAKEITAMLDESIQKVESIVNETKHKVSGLIQDGKQKIEHGTEIATNCGSVLDEIVENFSSVTHMANEISVASQEQSQGVQEITKAMNQLDAVTQVNASASEQTAHSAVEMSSQSESLRQSVYVLASTIRGGGDHKTEESHSETPRPKHQHHSDKVVPMKKKTQHMPMKKAVGMDDVPSATDSRFEEV